MVINNRNVFTPLIRGTYKCNKLPYACGVYIVRTDPFEECNGDCDKCKEENNKWLKAKPISGFRNFYIDCDHCELSDVECDEQCRRDT